MGLVRSVDLAELRAFCAAVDLGSLGSAARLLRVSQPALSKRMRALEALAGRSAPGPLAARHRHDRGRRAPVRRGAQAARPGRRRRGADGRPLERGRSGAAGGEPHDRRVRPARAGSSSTSSRAGATCRSSSSSRTRWSCATWSAPDGRSSALPPHESGLPLPGLEQVHFCDDEVVVAVPHGHPWAELDAIEPEQLVAEPLVVRDPTREHAPDGGRGARRARAAARPAARRGRQHERGQGDGALRARARPALRDRASGATTRASRSSACAASTSRASSCCCSARRRASRRLRARWSTTCSASHNQRLGRPAPAGVYTPGGARPYLGWTAWKGGGVDLRDPEAFQTVYATHSRRVYANAYRILGDAAKAEDTVQDVFLRLWLHPDRFDERRGELGSYLALMARSRALDIARSDSAGARAGERLTAARRGRPAAGRAAGRARRGARALDPPARRRRHACRSCSARRSRSRSGATSPRARSPSGPACRSERRAAACGSASRS